MTARKLPVLTKVYWGVGQIGEGVKTSAFNSFLLFYYTQIIGVSATSVSIVLAIAVIFDAISDPLTGSISDGFKSRWGRRHPFMAASAAPMAICLFLLFSPPSGMSDFFYCFWALIFAVAVRTFLTLYHIPHLALGAEMARDYADRNSLFSFGLFFGAVAGYGFYFIMLSTFFAPQPGLSNGMYNPEGYSQMAASAGIIAFIAIMLCVWGTRKEIPYLQQDVPDKAPLSYQRVFNELSMAFSSPSYRSIFFGLMLSTVVLAVEAAFTPFMGVHFWGLETNQLKWIPVAIVLGLPLGTILAANLAKVVDKKWCLIIPAIITTINVNVLIVLRLLEVFPDNGHWIILPLLVGQSFISAVVAPVVFITINSMFADISDELELSTGSRQEGIIYSARAFAAKAAAAIGMVVGGVALDIIAFPEKAVPGQVDAQVIFNLGLVQGPATSIFMLAAIASYTGYKLSRKRHSEIVSQLNQRQALQPQIEANTSDGATATS